jgi:hypothetical protein
MEKSIFFMQNDSSKLTFSTLTNEFLYAIYIFYLYYLNIIIFYFVIKIIFFKRNNKRMKYLFK